MDKEALVEYFFGGFVDEVNKWSRQNASPAVQTGHVVQRSTLPQSFEGACNEELIQIQAMRKR